MILLSMVIAVCYGHGQVVKIIDGQSKEPLIGVNVKTSDSNHLVISNGKGQVDLSTFKSTDQIIISYIGYESKSLWLQDLNPEEAIELHPSKIILDEVMVSATRWKQRKRDVPMKISTIGMQDVALKNPQTAADLLGMSGEVYIQKSQLGGGSPMIRGFSTNRLLYTVDGVRMNTAIFRSGNLQNVISIDPLSVATTEVVFGPGSVIYGSDAIGGVMSFQTLEAQRSSSGDLEVNGSGLLRYSTAAQERTGHFDLNLGWGKWASLTSISSNEFNDLRMGRYGPDDYLRPFFVERIDGKDVHVDNPDPLVQKPTGYQQINMLQKLRYRSSEFLEFDFSTYYSATSDYPRYDRHIRLRNGLQRSGQWDYGPQIWSMSRMAMTSSKAQRFWDELTLQAAFQRFEESRLDRNLNDPFRNEASEKVDAYSLNLDFVKSFENNLRLFYGVEGILNDVTSFGQRVNIESGEEKAGPSRYPNAEWWSNAIYGTAHWDINSRLKLQAGLRYNLFSLAADFSNNLQFFPFEEAKAELNHGALSGNLGLVWAPQESSWLSLNLASGFRAPNVDDIGKVFDSEPGAVVVPNPSLQAEEAYNIEIGWHQRIANSVKLDLAIYYTYLDHAMVRRDFILNGQDSILYNGELSKVQAIQNAANAFVYGTQIGVEYKFAKHWSWMTKVSYQQGEEELDDGSTSPSRHVAPWFALSTLEFKQKKLVLDLSVQYNGERSFEEMPISEIGKAYLYALDKEGRPYSPSWYSVNFHGRFEIDEQWTISGGIENITDQRYRPYSSGLTAAGRNFILGVGVKF